jgi:hypothetical protein
MARKVMMWPALVVGMMATALMPSASVAAVFTVGPGGTHTTVQQAVNAAMSAGGSNEVRIAAGTFAGQVWVSSALGTGALLIGGGWNSDFTVQVSDPSLTVLNGGGGGSALMLSPSGGSVTVEKLTVTGGRNSGGGGVSVLTFKSAKTTIVDCRIVGNEASNDAGTPSGGGLGAQLYGTSVLELRRVLVVGNSAKATATPCGPGGVSVTAGGTAQLLIEDSTISGNSATSHTEQVLGAGLRVAAGGESVVTLRRNVVARNIGTPKSGLTTWGSSLTAGDTARIDCSSSAFFESRGGNADQSYNLGLDSSDSGTVTLSNSLVAGTFGRGLFMAGNPLTTMRVINCTLAGHPISDLAGEATSVHNTIIRTTQAGSSLKLGTSGGNLIGVDPQFVNAALHDYRLRPGSPAINAGVASPPGGLSTTDFSGRTRVVGGKVDIGAHEYPGTTRLAAAALAHTLGFNNTPWRSDLDLHNAGAGAAALTAHYITSTGSQTKPVTLSAGETRAWHDVLFSLFGVNASAKTSGSLEIEDPTGAVAGVVRTYADGGAAGTYGQGYPQLGEHDGLSAGDTGIMPIVKSNAKFYSNIGIQNLGTARGEARVTLYGQNGLQLGTPVMIAADPGCWAQSSDVFAKAGVQGANVAYARLKALTAGVRVWGAASVIDRSTKDPTTVEAVEPVAAGTVLRVASVAHAAGFGGTPWRSTVAVVNSEESAGKVTLTFRGASTIVKTVQLGGRAALEWADVLVELFGVGVGDTASGALEVVATRKVVVASRTYADRGAAGTYGQSYPALTNDRGVWAGTTGVLLQLRKNAKTYTNIGALNLSSVPCAGSVQLLDDQGHAIGSPLAIATAAGGWTQISDAFLVAGAGGADAASARVTTVTEGCSLWYYASVIDSLTRDPTTVELSRPLEVEPAA